MPVNEKREPEPVIFKMLDNGYAETRTIPAGVKPPARVFHPELRMGTQPRQTEWGDRVWIKWDAPDGTVFPPAPRRLFWGTDTSFSFPSHLPVLEPCPGAAEEGECCQAGGGEEGGDGGPGARPQPSSDTGA